MDQTRAESDTDAIVVRGLRPPSARVPLSRERVLRAAVAFLDEHGLGALTMRRLAEGLGVEAMSLYRYVPGRDGLLDGVVEMLVTELKEDDDVLTTAAFGWQEFLQRLAHGVRKIALRHPKSFPLLASRPPEAPWLRPPLRSLEWVEVFLRVMVGDGFSEAGAVAAYRAFTSFLLGSLLLEVGASGADVVGEEGFQNEEADTGLHDYPLLASLAPLLAEARSAVEFDETLENLLDRLARLR